MREPGRFLAALLSPAAAIYGAAVALRNRRYDGGGSAVHRAPLPVISVGNLTVGGTGKTPVVMEIVRRLRGVGVRAAVVTRGYAAAPGQKADEVLEFREALPDTPVVVNPDRVRGARDAATEHGAECVVLDDGFQHRRLARDLDIVLIDALAPWGGGRLLPAGRLREPLRNLRRAQAVIITRANQTTDARCAEIEQCVGELAPRAACIRSEIRPLAVCDRDGRSHPPEHAAAQAVLAVCGIGNPATFEALLRNCGVRPVAVRRFRDHHRYTARDVEGLVREATRQAATVVLTTRKDWVKLAPLWPSAAGPTLLRLDVEARLLDTGGALLALLRRAVARDSQRDAPNGNR
ncbi:MAG: tetraacyldisaccharide 4'-kinase [Phycisphaerales bacterium]|nr:tetraacyldisaccharide 4'-kinase [Phycisphaerales bacterium]